MDSPTTIAPPKTLKEMREARGLSLTAAAALLAEQMGEKTRTSVSYLYIERHGSSKYEVRKALAKIYDCDLDDIDKALSDLPRRRQWQVP